MQVGAKVEMGVASWDGHGEQQEDDELAQSLSPADQPRTDAVRSWLFNGIHAFAVDPRRRLGGHGHARRLLAGDRRSVGAVPGAWRELVSALQRHTVHSGLAQLSAEERNVITLAYLQGRTNHQIAAMLGVSVSTVRRRLWMALEHLDDYARRTGTWISSLLLIGFAYVVSRAAWIGRTANAVGSSDWSHRLAATVAAVAVTTTAFGLVVVSPDSSSSAGQSRPPATALALPTVSDTEALALPPANQSPFQPDAATRPADRTVSAGGAGDQSKQVSKVTAAVASGSGNHGCHGNPTNAPPKVPVASSSSHPTGAPVTHPTAGGCRA